MRKIAIALMIGLFLASLPYAKADYVGVGLQCRTYGEAIPQVKHITVGDVINELLNKDAVIDGGLKCINYGVYNPFDVKLNTTLHFTGEVKDILVSLEPETVEVDPEKNKNPSDALEIRACFKIQTKYPYTPKKYGGSTMAVWSMGRGAGGTGSATGGSVECPLYLQVNTEAGQKEMLRKRAQALFKLQVLVVVVIALIILLVALTLYRRKKKKEWKTKVVNVCPKCKKKYPLELKYCPKCGSKLKKYKAGKEIR